MACNLPVELLEEIFLRLHDDTADLVRVSAACASFRRVVSNDGFLRRFRSVSVHRRRRPILGLLLVVDDPKHIEAEFLPAEPPRSSAVAAAGFARAADFGFSFLPADLKIRRVCDVRDGRVLLTSRPHPHYFPFGDHVAYDPLHRRHVQIPTIPYDLLRAVEHGIIDGNPILTFHDPFFLAADDHESSSSSLGFRVMCTAQSVTKLVAFVFSASSAASGGQWRCAASFSTGHPNYVRMSGPSTWLRQNVHGCVCWVHYAVDVMLVLDTREMEFSIAHLPRKSAGKFKMAVEAEDGRIGLLFLVRDDPRLISNGTAAATTMDLYSMPRQGIQEPEEWRHDCSSIPIMPGFDLLDLFGAADGYVLLRGMPRDQLQLWFQTEKKEPETHYFTLELKTLSVEKLCVLLNDNRRSSSFLYASFPPPFSPPSV